MNISPKLGALLIAIFGFGLGFLGILITERQIAFWPTVISSTLVGSAWAASLVLVSWYRGRSERTGLSGEWYFLFTALPPVAALLDLGVEAAYATGAYGFVLLAALQIREWHCQESMSWNDLKRQRANEEG